MRRGDTKAGLALSLAALLTLMGCIPQALVPKSEAPSAEPRTITVTGVGQASAAPDVAAMSVGVIVSDVDITVAIDRSNQTIDSIQQAIQALGVEPADFHTTNFSVWPEDKYDPNTGQLLPQKNYRVESSLEVRVRQVDNVGKVLEAAIQNGANNIYGLNFQIQDTDGLASQARAAAISDARARAEQVAQAMGVTLGDVVSATEVSGGQIYPMYSAGGIGGGGGEPPISEGEMSVSVQMQVCFKIEP